MESEIQIELPEELQENFEYVCFIGSGTFGNCFLLTNKEKTEFYALKVAKNSGSLYEEGEKTSNLSIPLKAKTKCFSSKEAEDSWILMDYIPGASLNQIINYSSDCDLRPAVIVKILAALCNTVSKLHEQNIIHRDIKPDNIMIDGDFNAHLIDFGDIGEIMDKMTIRQTYHIHGTIPYDAPEVFCYQPTLKSDIFSIGATMFQMITNDYPFKDLYSTKEGVKKYKMLIEDSSSFMTEYDNLMETFEELEKPMEQFEEEHKKEDKTQANYIFDTMISKRVDNIVKNLVCKGFIDRRYAEGTDIFNSLPVFDQKIMKLAYKCMSYDQNIRPTSDEIIDELLTISHNELPEDVYNDIEEYVASLDKITTQTYGTKEFVAKALDKHFDAINRPTQRAACQCFQDYEEKEESEFEETFGYFSNIPSTHNSIIF